MKTTKRKRKTKTSIQQETLNIMCEVSRMFPQQDPIRLTVGLIDFNLPMERVLKILRHLAPHFKGENADMIRLASGYLKLNQKIKESRIATIVKNMK